MTPITTLTTVTTVSRITGAEVRKGSAYSCQDRAGWCQGCWDNRLAAQLDADASLATRLAEAEEDALRWEREAKVWSVTFDKVEAELARLREKLAEAERVLDVCDCCAGSGVPVSGPGCICGGKGTALAERQGLRAELARLRPLAAEWEAVEKVLAHPMRDKDWSFGWEGSNAGGVYCRAVGVAGQVDAPDFPALALKLAALVPKPEPEDWRWVWPTGYTTGRVYSTASQCREVGKIGAWSGRPMRRTVDPTTGVVTLTPAEEEQ